MRQSTSPEGSFDPFLPYDKDLFVATLSDSHVCLLNKFNVMDHHLLIVTRAFEEQEALLDRQDFDAVWACMVERDGLTFYNGGGVAGASQRHKHLRFVPLPLGLRAPPVPIEPLLGHARFRGTWEEVPALGYKHALARLDAVGVGLLQSADHPPLDAVGAAFARVLCFDVHQCPRVKDQS